jgi:hypothetical protein
MGDFMKETNEKREQNRKSRKYVTVMLALITLVFWAVFLVIKIWIAKSRGSEFDFSTVLDGILDNLLGVIPPIIIFNFAYEYFTQDYMSEEMSEQITQTLMSDPRAIARFDKEAKETFVYTTLLSMLKEEQGKMVYGMIKPYLHCDYNIRKFFKYKFIISEYTKDSIFPREEYLRIQEKLTYKKYYMTSNSFERRFKIGFFIEDVELDSALKNHQFLFREDLKIQKKELDKLISLDTTQKKAFVLQGMRMKVFINNNEAELENVIIDDTGILLEMNCMDEPDESFFQKEVTIEVGFMMPMLKSNCKIFASISEPTYSPNIELSYPEDKFKVTMLPFLNGNTLSKDAMHYDGICEIAIHDEWIMPMSGVAFLINAK